MADAGRLWELYDEAMRQWHEEMREHFGPISPSLEDWGAYIRERPAPVAPLVERPTTPGGSAARTPMGTTPALGTTPRGTTPRFISSPEEDPSSPAFQSSRPCGLPGPSSGLNRRRTLNRTSAPSSSRQSPVARSPNFDDTPSTSGRHQSSARARGCCGGSSDDVEEGAHRRPVLPPADHQTRREPARELHYTIDDVGAIVMDGRGKTVRGYVHDSVHSHVRNVYDDKTYRSNVIDHIVTGIHS